MFFLDDCSAPKSVSITMVQLARSTCRRTLLTSGRSSISTLCKYCFIIPLKTSWLPFFVVAFHYALKPKSCLTFGALVSVVTLTVARFQTTAVELYFLLKLERTISQAELYFGRSLFFKNALLALQASPTKHFC